MTETPEEVRAPGFDSDDELHALAELSSAEFLADVAEWCARWAAKAAGADGAVVWTPHGTLPLFVCVGAAGEGTERAARRSAPRATGLLHDIVRDREILVLGADDLGGSSDPWIQALPVGLSAALAVPVEADGDLVAILGLAYRGPFDADSSLEGLSAFLETAVPALRRALLADRKAAGMLHAIERLTNLFDLTKAFASTIDLSELVQLVARKAVDFGGAEVASLWLLEGDDGEVALSATAVNENYSVDPAPGSVGAGVVGDVLAEQEAFRRNGLAEEDPAGASEEGYRVRSLLAVPLVENEAPVGALVLANKRGRNPEFSDADEELLLDLSRQAVRALRNARLYEAEKKVEELAALLTVSREITATLDFDKVMSTVVNASAALIRFERCSIAVLQRGRLRLGAVSAMAEVDRSDESVKRSEALLEWVFFGGADVAVTRTEDGSIVTERPETEEKFRVFFEESGRNAFYGVLLKDEEGKVGVLGFECDEPIVFDGETRDLLQILVNQATVALRNAQLYQQVPMAGFLQPVLQKWRKVQAVPARRVLTWAGAAVLAVLVLALVPWRIRVGGPAKVIPARRVTVTASVGGFLRQVRHREGDVVPAGEVLAVLRDEEYLSERAAAAAALEIAESDVSRLRAEGDQAAAHEAAARRDALKAKIALAESRLARTRITAPSGGVVITPHLEQKVGTFLEAASELCTLADVSEATFEVAVPESESAELRTGEPVWVKMNSYPSRTFRGAVQRIGAAVHEEGEDRFVLVESRIENPEGLLRPGMLGKAKVSIGRHSLATALFRKPLRYAWTRIWRLLP